METSRRPIALITGGSRGIGAATTLALAQRGYDVVITYRNKSARANEVVAASTRYGVRALAVACDITQQEQVTELYQTISSWSQGYFSLLVLNASGGMERDLLAADPDYPMHINRDAQLFLVEGALPLMSNGGDIVFITSHWAHLYGQIKQLPDYTFVAESKYAGEQALRARLPEFTARNIRLLIVTGDLIAGTITPKLLERSAPGLAAQRISIAGTLPTAEEMGEIIAASAVDPTLPSGHVVVVGGTLESLPRS
ncbi:MAG TPA: SDR family oxidoreductase [Ktedonobacteraceae bacterium]|jgi:NAD(P)-dependent dehydrogenase (short-subunit alcohol dehydrogenase family)